MTNADKIRSMTDEELAEYLYNADVDCNMCCAYENKNCHDAKVSCKDGILEWLGNEVDEE